MLHCMNSDDDDDEIVVLPTPPIWASISLSVAARAAVMAAAAEEEEVVAAARRGAVVPAAKQRTSLDRFQSTPDACVQSQAAAGAASLQRTPAGQLRRCVESALCLRRRVDHHPPRRHADDYAAMVAAWYD